MTHGDDQLSCHGINLAVIGFDSVPDVVTIAIEPRVSHQMQYCVHWRLQVMTPIVLSLLKWVTALPPGPFKIRLIIVIAVAASAGRIPEGGQRLYHKLEEQRSE